jgi:hypothetical protein
MDQQPKNDIDFLEPSVLLDDTQYQEGYKTGYNDGLVSGKEEACAGVAALCGARRRPALVARAGGQPSMALRLRPSASTHGFFSTKGNTVFLLHH